MSYKYHDFFLCIDAIDEQCNRMEEFFRNANNVDPKERDKMFQSSMQCFDVIIDDANAKCKLADQMHQGLRMCLTKIDDKIADFKMDLEFSDPGMAGIIERKVEAEEESEATSVAPKKKKRNTKKDTKKNKW